MTLVKRLLFSAVTMIICCFTAMSQNTRVKAPDFAYPLTVSTDARRNLDKAIGDDDAQGILRSLIDYTLAQSSTDTANLPACLTLIDSVKGVSDNPVLGSMLSMLEAVIYNNIYSSSRWKYDNRTSLSASPLPVDYTEWSGEQFRHRITGLIDNALADSVALRAVPLAKYSGVINQNRMTTVYYPTLYNFVVSQAMDIMQGFVVRNGLPLMRDSIGERILALYDSVIYDSPRWSAPEVNARLDRLEFQQNHSDYAMIMSSDGWRGAQILDLYRSYLSTKGRPETEYAGDILLAIPIYSSSRREIYDLCKSFIAACPGYWRKDCIMRNLRTLEQKSVAATAPRVVAPGSNIDIEVTLNNVDHMSVDIYDVSSAPVDTDDFTFTTGMAGARKVASLPVEVKGERVPFEVNRKVTYSFSKPGNYIAVPVLTGVSVRRENFTKIHVTKVAMAATLWLDRTLWAVDAENGAPLSGVTVSVNPSPYRSGSTSRRVGVTDSIGAVRISDKNGVATAVYGDDRYALPLYIYDYNYTRPDKWIMHAQGYPSLPLYHPGDSMEWTAICYEYKGGLNRPYALKDVTAVLMDANHMPVDTLKLVTDRFGRVAGGFTLPTDGLTGRFSVNIGGDESVYALGFEVSDYKLPTFRVLSPVVEQDAPAEGDVTVRGHVETYAGFPIADAEVTLTLSVARRPRWWFPSTSYDVYSHTVRTDAAGDYEVVIGKDVFSSSPIKDGYYTAEISVLSSAGETQTGAVSFGRTERYIIKAVTPHVFDMTRGAMPLEVRVVNYEDSLVTGGVNVELVRNDSVTVSRTHIDGNGSLDVASLGQGIYNLVMSRENADTVRNEIILYNPEAKESPCPDVLLWAPVWKLTAGSGRDNTWTYAVNCDTHLLVTLWTPEGIISQRWVKADKGFNRLPVTLPDGVDDATLSIVATGGYRQQSCDIGVTRADSERGLKIVAESFRDRIVPGNQETWTLRVTDLKGNGREAAVISDMYNTALDVLAKTDWTFTPVKGYLPGFRSNLSNLSSRVSYYMSGPSVTTPRLKCPPQVDPVFNTYGKSWGAYLNGRLMVRGLASTRMMKKEMADGVEVEEVAMDFAAADAGGAVPMMNASAKMSLAESTAVTTTEESSGTAVEESVGAGETFAYRESNVPLAFFRPSLVTDREGRLALSFTVPDANTTWGLRMLAFTDSLLSATFARDVIASKDIMVQPNLPRFVRTGDRAVVQASVMNATEEVQYVSTEVEIFNPADGSHILTFNRPDTIAPDGSVLVDVEFTVPSGMTFVGYRIKSSTATHADGEQALIPVLPSVTPVIDTYPFYMSAERHEMSVKMPEIPKSGTVTLQFCENPAWYVVTALPGLLVNESSTSIDAARAIYSAAVARGLLKDNPVIADAVREWSEGDGSSEMLKSMLERNSELKNILLAATPWMLDARNDTERMARLALLFDRKVVDKTIDDNIALLAKLSCADGGWGWCSSYPEQSRWATVSVLEYMGHLVRLGYLPDDSKLTGMISDALKWDTAKTREEFGKYPDGDYSRYVYIHDFFEGAGFGAPDASVVNSVTQRILRDWKDAPLATKAMYAQILYRHNYRSMSGQILGSIRQFAETSPEKGMWFPSLDNVWYGGMDNVAVTAFILETFHLLESTCPEIDLLRQWLIIQKGAQNWGSGATATYVIGAILSTSASWFTPAEGATVKMGRTRVEPEKFERMTGEFEVSFPAAKVSGQTLRIERKSDSPSWGAVYCQYQSDMTDVKSSSCPELSVTKSVPDSVAVGDHVTVRLVVKADADMDYVTIIDNRPACFEPVEQMPAPLYAEGLRFYRENRDASTRIFIDHLPKGTYILTYDVWVNNAGQYTSGIATAQSQYAPRYSAHSGGGLIFSGFAPSK